MSEQETATTPETPTTTASHGETFSGDNHGIRAAAEEVAEKRRSEGAETELSLREAREAVAEVAQRREAEKKGVELVEATKKHQENLSRENLTLNEAADVLATERGLAQAQAESDLNEILGERREAEAQPRPQPEPQPDNEAQARLTQHVTAQKLAAADSHAAQQLSQIALAHHRLVAHVKAQFPELAGRGEAEAGAAVAAMPAERQRRFAQLDAESRRLWGAAQAWQGERVKYAQISNGEAQRAEADRLRAWAQAEDAKAVQKIPELQNPKTAKGFQGAMIRALENAGIRRENMVLSNPAFLSAVSEAGQLITADAARLLQAKEGLEQKRARAKQRPAVKVQRPGGGKDVYGFHRGGDVASLSRELSGTKGDKQVRLAAQLLRAKRDARAG